MYDYDEDYLDGMCEVCNVNYADNPHLLCEECKQEAYDNTYALEEWINDDGFDEFLEWFYDFPEYRDFSISVLHDLLKLEDDEAKDEGYKEYAQNHFKNYEEWYVSNKNYI